MASFPSTVRRQQLEPPISVADRFSGEPTVTLSHPPVYINDAGEVSTVQSAGFMAAYAPDAPLPLNVARALGLTPVEGA
jgi:hypothetical protein